ncbi:DMT family transporter [Candidatus Micrarchaeota archaeon]|nr:DMT family transporter [Candidatus Micrarchaeota archaeon]
MLEYLPIILALLVFSISIIMIRTNTERVGRYKAITYMYFSLSFFLLLGAVFLKLPFTFPLDLLPAYLAQVIIGSMAIIVFYKAIEQGKVSIISPLSSLYVVIVFLIGTFLLSESISQAQLIGSLTILSASLVLAFSDVRNFKLEKGVVLLIITIFGWGYYYSFIKIFVSTLGFYMGILFVEVGISVFVALYYLAKRKDLSPPPLEDLKHLFLRGFVVFFGVLLHSLSVQNIGVVLTSGVGAAGPIVDVALSYLFLKERLDFYKYLAIALMVIGLVVIFVFG